MNTSAAIAETPETACVVDDPLERDRFSRIRIGANGRQECESGLQISGISCAACAGILQAALLRVHGVLDARVSAANQRVGLRWIPRTRGHRH